MRRDLNPTPHMEDPLMFEHTRLLSHSGGYRTTADLISAVKERLVEDRLSLRRSRNRRMESLQKAATRRARVRKHQFRRHRTAS
jgi:hypothetical protein